MAASSRGDEDAEERRALEQELAAELAALSAQDVGFDENWSGDIDANVGSSGESNMDYVRLDLDNIMKEMTKGAADEGQNLLGYDEDPQAPCTSWELLLQSVERSDREFFQPCHEILHEINSSILSVKFPLLQQDQQPIIEGDVHTPLSYEKIDGLNVEVALPLSDNEKLSIDKTEEGKLDHNAEDEKFAAANSIINVIKNKLAPFTASKHANLCPVYQTWSHLVSVSEEEQPVDERAKQQELQTIARQKEARELQRLKIQARYEKERADAAQLLLRLEEEFKSQEKNEERHRQEERESSLMTTEETFCRKVAAAECEANEMALMALADKDSHTFALELAWHQDVIAKEITQMIIEDKAERHRIETEQQTKRQKQKAMARYHFTSVLGDLSKYHQVQRQIRDKETKRERRECVQMRAEEALTRRLIVEHRALRELQERVRNRVLMVSEDELASVIEDVMRSKKLQAEQRSREKNCRYFMDKEEKRTRSAWIFIDHLQLLQRQKEEQFRVAMETEETRCQCAWMYLAAISTAEAKKHERHVEAQRRILSNMSTGFHELNRVYRQHALFKYLSKWKRSIKEDRRRSATANYAAKKIQMWHRSCRQKLQEFASVASPLVLQDFSDDEEQPQVQEDGYEDDDNDTEVLDTGFLMDSIAGQEAARRLQSTFRGFYVRRKLANALALAQAVEEHEERDLFDAVDLDDMIQLPPELEDGWEDPVLPSAKYPVDREKERFNHMDNNEMVEYETDKISKSGKTVVKTKNAPISPLATNPLKETTLAATLWNKMKRVKQRQQHTQQERQRQQDPVYRVQKLLNRKVQTRHISNQNDTNQISHLHLQTLQGTQKGPNLISWSSTTSTKKKPKVQLPSLVERLRRQTMAER